MSAAFRTATGGRIDRTKQLAFTFDGVRMIGHPGDTLASALTANGVRLIARSFKYHRPRGLVAAGSEEPNALVTVIRDDGRTTPNLAATTVELYDGLVAVSQNRWPSLKWDVGALNDLFSPIFVSGFYYKTFMWPRSFWQKVYEPRIRAAAGFGEAPKAADPDRYANRFAHCDVLVIGAGPTGLAAARAAAEAGVRVILCDENPELGGSLLADPSATIDGEPGAAWAAAIAADLAARETVTLLTRTTAFGYYQDNMVGLLERVTDHLTDPPDHLPRERLWQVRAKRVVIAAGALERPLVFPENDRPGIMLADAARTFLARHGVAAGSRAVVFTATDSAYAAAIEAKAAGVSVALVADLRREASPAAAAARAAGIRVDLATTIEATSGGLSVESVRLARIAPNGSIAPGETVACDLVLHSAGFTPTVHLFSQSRGKLRFDAARGVFLPGEPHEDAVCAGACNGAETLAAALAEGHAAGATSARAATGAEVAARAYEAEGLAIEIGGHFGEVPHGRDASRVKCFVDLQHDVTAKDIRLATREGFRSIEHVKRFTTTGMATDQGKSSNMNALAVAAATMGLDVPQVGLTTFRRPYTPVSFGAFAGVNRGDLFDPIRRTPSHHAATALGAPFEDVGLWKRAWWFPRDGEDRHAAVARECRTVRETFGVFDASTLGKIEVVGPDAAEFLNRMYVNPFLKLGVGRCRYGILCRDDGFVYDDGVVGRIAEDRFHVTTTTGGAPRVLAMMEDYLQTEWPELDVWATSTTEQWAVVAVQGPKAREVIAPLVAGVDLSTAALPHMSVAECRILGLPGRLFRVSFTGELGYELNVPAEYGAALWDAVLARATALGGCAYGTETMHVLRAEKGYIIVGQDTDGTLTPADAGLGWAVGRTKPDFVGKAGMARPDLVGPHRKEIVGLLPDDPKCVLDEGAQITADAHPAKGAHALGHVTSAYWSENVGRGIALAMIEGGRSRMGTKLHVPMPAGPIAVTVVDPVFWDKEGKRLDG
jgi:sarcosine oxidase subunit alpha